MQIESKKKAQDTRAPASSSVLFVWEDFECLQTTHKHHPAHVLSVVSESPTVIPSLPLLGYIIGRITCEVTSVGTFDEKQWNSELCILQLRRKEPKTVLITSQTTELRATDDRT